jgi:hypothetical protein
MDSGPVNASGFLRLRWRFATSVQGTGSLTGSLTGKSDESSSKKWARVDVGSPLTGAEVNRAVGVGDNLPSLHPLPSSHHRTLQKS